MKNNLEWQECPGSDNIFAETSPTSRYWICYRGNEFRLEHVTILNRFHDWRDLGCFKTISGPKNAAEITSRYG